MPKQIVVILIAFFIIGGIFLYLFQRSEEKKSVQPEIKTLSGEETGKDLSAEGEIKNMKIESSAFRQNEAIPSKYTCDGENVNPPLKFSRVPEDAKSLVLIVDDPDAPSGTWVHWTVWNIAPRTEGIGENDVPQGAVEGLTDFGKPGYGGPCPPSGTHRYFFKVFALDITLDLDSSAKIEELEKAMEGHILAKDELIGLYQRQ